MKRGLIILLFLLPIIVSAKSYKKLLSEYDIIEFLPEQSNGDAASFWMNILDKNEELMSSFKKVISGGGSAKDARVELYKNLSENRIFIEKDAEPDSYLDSMKYIITGNYFITNECTIFYLGYDDINACCVPKTGNLYFDVFVCKGLLETISKKTDNALPCLYAVLAHEFTHGLFLHSLFHLYKKIKKEKSNALLAGIANGMAVYHDTYSKARGTQSQIEDIGEYSQKINDYAKKNAMLYQIKYSREQEYQADIIAFRLLDWIGIGGENVISMLNIIQEPFEYSDEYSDHPSIDARIKLLEYMCTQKRVIPKSE